MAAETDKLVSSLSCGEMDALEISGSYWVRKKWKSFRSLNYPDFDICGSIDDRELYDIIFAEQVFEHLAFPSRAARNVYQMLRPNGYFMPTVPFLIKLHPTPLDCTRWSPQGFKFFLMDAGFDEADIKVFAWGNRACAIANFTNWTEFQPELHSLHNEPDFPVVVWALAQKKSAPA